MRRTAIALAASLVCAVPSGADAQQPKSDRKLHERLDDIRRKEGDALLAMVDAAMRGRPDGSDFAIGWRNDFFKAQPGTFVPFTLTIDRSRLTATTALLYVRTVARDAAAEPGDALRYPFDAVFPVDLSAAAGEPITITRGFAVPPGEYDVYVALRERADSPLADRQQPLKAAVLRQPLSVPDFWTKELTASTVMLADRIDELGRPLEPGEVFEHPYVIGQSSVHVARTATFRKDRELILVFLIYNPTTTPERNFDLQVEYHVFRQVGTGIGDAVEPQGVPADHPPARRGERYVTRTSPQRFNPSTLAAGFDPASGNPVMAGQGILLSSFQEGAYRIGITVTDLVSQRTLSRDVTFTVVGS